MRWLALLALPLAGTAAAGEELTVPAVVSTIRYHPEGEPAQVGFTVLSRRGVPGWKALAGLVAEFLRRDPDVARAAARAFAEGPEKERLALVAQSYLRIEDPDVRAILAVGLAYGYADHEALLLKHMRENRKGAVRICSIVARELPERELRDLLKIPDLAPVCYAELKRRRFTVKAQELVPWAREIAHSALDPALCGRWTRDPDFLVLEAVALVLDDWNEDVREGAHCLLLTLSGRKLPRDPLVWRSWIAAQKDRYEPPDDLSPGRIHAAVVRGARWLRHDLMHDGRSVWAAEPNGDSAIGATGLAVLGLRAAGFAADHPAIEKALRTTLLVFGPKDAPALPAIQDRSRETYVLSILAMALSDLDPKRYRVPLEALKRRLVVGMQADGWGYRCIGPTDSAQPSRGDNSITQYAVLALRALHRAGFEIEERVWRAVAAYLYRTVNPEGGFCYTPGRMDHQVSMTSAGISSLAICFEHLYGGGRAADHIGKDPILRGACTYLGRMLMESGYGNTELYACYGVERACALTGTKGFRSEHRTFDWYERGARHLVSVQAREGNWGYDERRVVVGRSYGPAVDTAYGILFLTRATATIGSGEGRLLDVAIENDEPEPPPERPEPEPDPPPRPPELRLEWDEIPTRAGAAEIRGVLGTPRASLTLDGRPVPVDARGRFAVPLTVATRQAFTLVATGEDGLETTRKATVVFDNALPELELLGPEERHVGKQVLVFRSNEPLRSLQVAGRVYPADGPVVRAAVDVLEGRRTLTVIATDRAGNSAHREAVVEAVGRHLVLDGASAVGVELREIPGQFTVECWAKGDAPGGRSSLVANTEASGFGLFWCQPQHPLPYALVRAGGGYIGVDPRRPWTWSSWTHLALAYDGQRLRYFVNGRLQGEAEGGPFHPSGRRLWIGAQPTGHDLPTEFFRGAIDEVRLSGVARYERDFRPERTFMRDRKTLLLMHFDRDTVPEGILLDDSGNHHHGFPYGAPVLEGGTGSRVLAHARAEMRRLVPPPARAELTAEEHGRENARARESAKAMHLVPVTVRVRTEHGVPVPGLAVRALHVALDLSDGPAVTDGRGEAALRLPRGPWRIDLVTHEPPAGSIVFARVERAVRGPGREEIALDARRQVRFRTRLGDARAAHAVTLAWPDFSFHRRVEAVQGQLDIRTTGDAPMVVQAVRPPDDALPGYVLRRTVGPGTTIVDTEPADGTLHVFDGKGKRKLEVSYASADALPVPLEFFSKQRRSVVLAGLPEVVLGLGVDWGGRRCAFYPRPYALDGKERTFLGAPPFQASVGFAANDNERYGDRRHTVSIRIFLATGNGLLLSYDEKGAYTVSWEQLLDGRVLASGSVKPPLRLRTPPVDPKRVPDLRYRLRLRGPGENRSVEVAGHHQSADLHVDRARTWCFPEVAPNTRMWLLAVSRAIRAYEETCPVRRPRTDIHRSLEMPPGLAGMGGWSGAIGWMWLPEGSVYGFVDQWTWTGLLGHELGHVHGYMHGNPTETRIMRQAGRRAGRRLQAIRPGMDRVPEGNRYRALLEAVTRGEVSLEQDAEEEARLPELFRTGDAGGDGVLAPNLEITGDDALFHWYYRSMYGQEVDAARRQNAAAWSWLLTLEGFTDEEIQIAMFSRAANESLAWLARLRGTMVHDPRIAAAVLKLRLNEGKLPDHGAREAVLDRWRTKHLEADLAAEAALALREIGHRFERFRALASIAREHFRRGEPGKGETMVLRALAEARIGGDGMLESALGECAALWAAR